MAELERIKLTPEMKKGLIELEKDMRVIEEELRRAERAGIEVKVLREANEKAKRLREGLLREYG